MNTYFRIDENGYFNGVDQFDEKPEGWLEVRPPHFNHDSQRAKWDGEEWIIEEKTQS